MFSQVFFFFFFQQFSEVLYSDLIQIYLHVAELIQTIYKCLFWLKAVKQGSDINQIISQMRVLKYVYIYIFRIVGSSLLALW